MIQDNPDLLESKRSVKSFANDSEEDIKQLSWLGYKQELMRGFSALMSFSFSFTAVAVISSLTGLFTNSLQTGGPVVLVWSWVIGSGLNFLVGINLAEICSNYPSAGSVYHWAGCLSKEKHAPLLSYITGWFNFLGNAAGDAFFGFTFASSVNSVVILAGMNAFSTQLQVAIGISVCFVWTIQNIMRIDQQGFINNFSALWQVGTTIAVIVTIFVSCQSGSLKPSASQVFFSFYNSTGFESNIYVAFVGILTTFYSFTGYEAAGHMSEETKHAKTNSPLAIVYTVIATAIIGFAYIIGLLYASANNIDQIVQNQLGIGAIFNLCSGYNAALGLSIILTINMFFSGMSSMTVTTRIAFAMARDGAFPCSSYIRYIFPQTKSPLGAVILVFVVDALLILLNLANSTAFLAVTSISAIGYQISYAIPIFLRVTRGKGESEFGAFNLDHFGVICGTISVTWLVITSILFLLPTQYPITPSNMNYTVVVLGGVAIIGAIHWVTSARFWFVGPKRPHTLVNQ